MDIGYRLLDLLHWYVNNQNIAYPIVFSFVILGICAAFTYFMRDDLLRVGILVLIAGLFYILSVGGTAFQNEYFLNMSTEMIGTLAAIFIFASVLTSDGWTFPIIGTIIAIVISLLLIKSDDFNNGFALNMSTELLGAFLTTVILKRGWLYRDDKSENASQRVLNPIAHWAEGMIEKKRYISVSTDVPADYYLVVTGDSDVDVADKMEWLTRNGVQIIREKPIESVSNSKMFSQEVALAVDDYQKQTEAVTLSNQEARVRVLAYPDTAYRVHKQITEVMECGEIRNVHTASKELAHLEFTTTRPRFLFSDYVETQINLLIREWHDNPDDCLTSAAGHLLDWAVVMNFVKGTLNDATDD